MVGIIVCPLGVVVDVNTDGAVLDIPAAGNRTGCSIHNSGNFGTGQLDGHLRCSVLVDGALELVNLEQIAGIHFGTGCNVGQSEISRTRPTSHKVKFLKAVFHQGQAFGENNGKLNAGAIDVVGQLHDECNLITDGSLGLVCNNLIGGKHGLFCRYGCGDTAQDEHEAQEQCQDLLHFH